MAYNKGSHNSSSGGNRGRPYALMLLLAFGAALLGVMVLHKLRERRIYSLLVKEKDRDLLALQLLLQKERDQTKEMKRKNEEMKAKIYSLRSQKMALDRTVQEMKSTMDSLKEEEKVMESALEEKQNEIRLLQVKQSDLRKGNPEVMALKEKLEQKEAEIEDLKHRLEAPFKSLCSNDSTNLPEKVSANGKMAAQDNTKTENKETDEQPHGQFSMHGDGKGITNEDESKSKLINPKNGEITVGLEAEIPDKKGNIYDKVIERDGHVKRQETLQAEGAISGGNRSEDYQDDGSAGVTDEKIVDGIENATSREGLREHFENNTNGEGQNLSLKPLEDNFKVPDDAKRKHVHVSRTRGKRWRMIVKNRLRGNNGISEESHRALNMRSRQVNRDEQHEIKDRIRGRVIKDEDNERDQEEMGNDNLGKDETETKVPKPGSHDDTQDSQNKIVNDTNQQVTDRVIGVHPREQRSDEAGQSEQSWSRRHINIVEKNAGAAGHEKAGMLHEEHDEIKAAANVQEKEKDTTENEGDDDNISTESQPNFADEEEFEEKIDEFEEKIDESEFRVGL